MRNRHFEYYEQIDTNMPKDILHVRHNAGFFSCSFAALEQVMMFYNEHGVLPDQLDRSQQYMYYKHKAWDNLIPTLFVDGDGFFNQRKHYITDEDRYAQFSDYKKLRHADLKPFVLKYFMPSDVVMSRVRQFMAENSIDVHNTCAIFHRSNDKVRETKLPDDREYLQHIPDGMRVMLIPDTQEFLQLNIPNSFHVKQNDVMKHDKERATFMTLEPEQLPEHAINFLATVYIAAMCKALVTHSGNGGLWACVYRGHSEGIIQYLNGEWI